MRVTFLLTQSLESPSGLGRYWPLAKEMARLGHQVLILALHHHFQELEQTRLFQDGVEVRYVGQMHVLKQGNVKSYFGPARLIRVAALAAYRLTVHALQSPADVYHLGKPHPMNGVAALFLRLLRKRPVYLDCDDYEAASNRFGSGWQRRVVAFFEDRLPLIAAGITVNTHFVRRRLEALNFPADRIVHVPNGVDRERFSGLREQDVEALRQRLGIAGRPVVLYLGSLSLSNHAVDLLLEAFCQASSSVPEAVLLLVGGGEDYQMLQARAAELSLGERVRFLGRVPPDQAPLYYRLADLSVDPVRDSQAEQARSPLKLFESLVCGTPVVTGDVGDRGEILASGGGLLVAPGDVAALAQALVQLLSDPALRASLSAQALQVSPQFFWDERVDKFIQVYRPG